MVVEKGRVCVKIAGREAGKKCVIVDTVDENLVMIIGDGIKKRKCNIKHLELLGEKIEIKNESDDEIIKKLGKQLTEPENEQSKEQPEERASKKRTTKKRAGSKK